MGTKLICILDSVCFCKVLCIPIPRLTYIHARVPGNVAASSTYSKSIFHSAVIGDYTLGGSLSRENACSLQHLFYQMSSQSPLTTPATCRDPQTLGDEDTVVTIPIPQC